MIKISQFIITTNKYYFINNKIMKRTKKQTQNFMKLVVLITYGIVFSLTQVPHSLLFYAIQIIYLILLVA